MVGFLTWVCQVLKAIHCGDSALFREHPELLDSIVRVYFHSSSEKYNRMECWGPLKDAMEVKLRHVEMNNDWEFGFGILLVCLEHKFATIKISINSKQNKLYL